MALYALSVIPLLISDPIVSLSQMFLEAFAVKAHFLVFDMCISYASYGPIMLAEVRIDSQQLVALFNRII